MVNKQNKNKPSAMQFGPNIEGFARRGLDKRPVVTGDRIFIPITLFAETLPFAVRSTTPKGIVQVLPDTEIVIKDEQVMKNHLQIQRVLHTRILEELVISYRKLER